MRNILSSCLVTALVLQGCASSSSHPADNPSSRLPAWILNPDKPGFISVVGSAPRQDMGGTQAQYRVAMMKARQELAQMVRVRIKSTTEMSVEDRGGKVSREAGVDTGMQSSAELNLDSARVIEEWTDPEDGKLYIWLALPQ